MQKVKINHVLLVLQHLTIVGVFYAEVSLFMYQVKNKNKTMDHCGVCEIIVSGQAAASTTKAIEISKVY